MVFLKSCPRCLRGDLALEHDAYGTFFTCIQCGALFETSAITVPMKPVPDAVDFQVMGESISKKGGAVSG